MCYGGCDCQRCNPPDEPTQKVSAWTTERPTKAGLFWYRSTSNHEVTMKNTFDQAREALKTAREALVHTGFCCGDNCIDEIDQALAAMEATHP